MTTRVQHAAPDLDHARQILRDAQREEWLTVKEFAQRTHLTEKAVREAIRKERLAYRVVRLTTGPKGAIRILMPRPAA